MAGNKKNIIVGAARVYLGPALNLDADDLASAAASTTAIDEWRYTGGTAPAAGTPYTPPTTFKDAGYTQDGLEVATDPSFGEVEVDQLLDTPKIFKDGMGLTISTTFAEATLENLLIAWGQAAESLTSSAEEKELAIEAGTLGESPVERGLIAIGNAPEKAASNEYGERAYFAYRVTSVDASTHTLSRADATTIPVSFRALPQEVQTADGLKGRYGTVRDRLV